MAYTRYPFLDILASDPIADYLRLVSRVSSPASGLPRVIASTSHDLLRFTYTWIRMFPLTLPSFFFVSLACPYMWSLGENVRLARTSTLLGLDIISAAAVDRNLINWLPSVASIIAVEVYVRGICKYSGFIFIIMMNRCY